MKSGVQSVDLVQVNTFSELTKSFPVIVFFLVNVSLVRLNIIHGVRD